MESNAVGWVSLYVDVAGASATAVGSVRGKTGVVTVLYASSRRLDVYTELMGDEILLINRARRRKG
jgi:hypothetical protein